MTPAPVVPARDQYKEMFYAACASLGEISDALGIPEEIASVANGNEEILEAIRNLQDDRGTPVRASTAEVVLPNTAESTAIPVQPAVETSELRRQPWYWVSQYAVTNPDMPVQEAVQKAYKAACPTEKTECSLCAAGMNSFTDPDTGKKMHARNGTVALCSAQKTEPDLTKGCHRSHPHENMDPGCQRLADYEQVLADHRRLVRELDALLNGEGAAPQASLCDIVSQLRAQKVPANCTCHVVWPCPVHDSSAKASGDDPCPHCGGMGYTVHPNKRWEPDQVQCEYCWGKGQLSSPEPYVCRHDDPSWCDERCEEWRQSLKTSGDT